MRPWFECESHVSCQAMEQGNPRDVIAFLVLNYRKELKQRFGLEYPGHFWGAREKIRELFVYAEEQLAKTDDPRAVGEAHFKRYEQTHIHLSDAVCVLFEKTILPAAQLPAYA